MTRATWVAALVLAVAGQTGAAEWRSTGAVHPSDRVPFVYHGKVYQLRATQSRVVGSQRIGALSELPTEVSR